MDFINFLVTILGSSITATFITLFVNLYIFRKGRVKSQNEWRREKIIGLVFEFQNKMVDVNNKFLNDSFEETTGNLYSFFARQYFNSTTACIEKIEFFLNEIERKELKERYTAFINDRIESWIEAIEHSQDPDYEYKKYPDFNAYLSKLLFKMI